MSSPFPSRSVSYSPDTSSWTDVSSDLSSVKWVEREITSGTSTFEVTLNNPTGKYANTIFTLSPESGCGQYWKMIINGKTRYGRTLAIDIHDGVSGQTVTFSGGMVDERLKNYYLFGYIACDTLANMIQKSLNQFPTTTLTDGTSLKGLDVFTISDGAGHTLATMNQGPKFGYGLSNYDCSKTRPYVHDFIRDLLTGVNDTNWIPSKAWCGYVDNSASAISGVINIFPIGSLSYATTLKYGINVTQAVGGISEINSTRSIEQTKNRVEYVGGLSTSAPIDGDAWTETSSAGWAAVNASTQFGIASPLAGNLPPDHSNTDQHSIVAQSSSGGIGLSLHLPDVLGNNLCYDALFRNSLTLEFKWKGFAGKYGTTGIRAPTNMIGLLVALVDSKGTRINSADPTATIYQWDTSQCDFVCSSWSQFSRNVGINLSPYNVFTPSPGWIRTGGFNSTPFDWHNIEYIYFFTSAGQLLNALPEAIWIDQLHFTENYQPTDIRDGMDTDSILQYGTRMLYYDASQFVDDNALSGFARSKTKKMAVPMMSMNLTTSLGPEAEANGFMPGLIFPAAQMPTQYGLNLYDWRSIEVHTELDVNKGIKTLFSLTPASGPGYGPDMSQYEPRRFWNPVFTGK